jgi:hypothetical protein
MQVKPLIRDKIDFVMKYMNLPGTLSMYQAEKIAYALKEQRVLPGKVVIRRGESP